MASGPRRKRKNNALLASHQKSWIWGRYAVREALRGGQWPIVELFFSARMEPDELQEATHLARKADVAFALEEPERLRQLCHRKSHQGYLARMGPFPYAQSDSLIQVESGEEILVVLDGLQDPQNLGVVLRTAEVFGARGVLLEQSQSVGITAAVARSSAGAVHHLPVARGDLPERVLQMRRQGWTCLCASEKADASLSSADLSRGPIAWIIGNEAQGLRDEILQQCSQSLRIDQHGRIGSLNAAISAGIVLYETRRQRGG